MQNNRGLLFLTEGPPLDQIIGQAVDLSFVSVKGITSVPPKTENIDFIFSVFLSLMPLFLHLPKAGTGVFLSVHYSVLYEVNIITLLTLGVREE